jgi:opacity protein-like surface antigen
MNKRAVLLLSLMLLAAGGIRAQANQNNENYVLFGTSFASTQTIGGSVTVNGGTGFSTYVGFAFQVARKSAVSLWVDPFPLIIDTAQQTTSVPDAPSLQSLLFAPCARLMVPVQSRISLFATGGGGFGHFENYALMSDNPPQLKTYVNYHGLFEAGAGIDVRVARHISIRVDARDFVTGRDLGGVNGRNHILPAVGVAFHY